MKGLNDEPGWWPVVASSFWSFWKFRPDSSVRIAPESFSIDTIATSGSGL